MASINYGAREISVKIVYYGPGLSGKTTNLQIIHRKIPQAHKSDMVSLATETDRTLFFDFLPLDLGTIKGFATKFQLYTVPGQVYYNATRKLVLRGVDGVVFVADSAPDKIPENLESFQNLEDNLAEYHYKREEIPIIIQYNKRDIPNALSIEELQRQINKYNVPYTESVANKGIGVFDALKLMGKIVIDSLNKKYSRLSRGVASGGAAGGAAAASRPPQQATPQQRQQPYAMPAQQGYGGTVPASPYQQQPPTPSPMRPPVSQPTMQYPGSAVPMPPQGVQPRAPSIPGHSYPPPPPQAASQQYAIPQQEHNVQQRTGYSVRAPEAPKPPVSSTNAQQSYGFVNFEPLPIEPVQPKPQTAPGQQQAPTGYAHTPESKNAAFPQDAVPSADKSFPPAQQQGPGNEQQVRGSGHAVVYPQKQRPVRTQIDERDYSVYHVDSSPQSFPKSPSSNDAVPMDDTDIRMQKKLNTPPNKQQKGFLSKFFNRDE
jgi:signal recognition particle receptor subunit beta